MTLAVVCVGASASPSVAAPSDVLVIHCDQFRYDCFGAAGNPDVKTPNLDALAADGVRFTNVAYHIILSSIAFH
jgi:arylsulfatase A-like enzyme